MDIFLALIDRSSEAYQTGYLVGQIVGTILGILFLIGLPIILVFSIIKYVKTRKTGWLVGAIISAIPIFLIILGMAVGIYRGISKYREYDSADQNVPEDRAIITDDGLLKITLPSHWKLLDNLNEVATFQAGNLFREEYMIVISDSKLDFTGGLYEFSEAALNGLLINLQEAQQNSQTELEINGMKAVQYDISGTLNNVNITYLYTLIEGEANFYQIYNWTLSSKKEKAFLTFQSVIPTIMEQPIME